MKAGPCLYCKSVDKIVFDTFYEHCVRTGGLKYLVVIKCNQCGMCGPHAKTEEQAIKRWNLLSEMISNKK